MRILLAGAGGQLGRELQRSASGHDVLALNRSQMDITNAGNVMNVVRDLRPDVVVNAAAFTAVDAAESSPARAFAVNRDGPAHLALACATLSVPLIHISTDYVFDGLRPDGYREEDAALPLNVYGQSKLAGEEAIRSIGGKYVILRTSWLFSASGHNFVRTILRLAAERKELCVVADQQGCPTAAAELARAVMHLLESGTSAWGTYHFCQPGATTWYGFACAIVAESERRHHRLMVERIRPIVSAAYPLPAMRPANAVLDCHRFENTFAFQIRPWSVSLAEVMDALELQGS
ncbi:dTDP-4-dehydrorhamnose reductase [Mariprofundus erugo]|uniref:dTDP-4-dehydrorhamnose reductase n=1 Tax=Mariprofundus erugo TaxID=2528639 RepID=A0A5R9H341_9PROT|nr:dTDP-4-dehydrorhamnose reductase [Mariprofundus erugo]TLS69094.1 dTDP-4-dehydrorhamnose reductase [Mariprofundus erugo]